MSLRKPTIYFLAVTCLASPFAAFYAFSAAPTAPGAPVSGKDLLVAPVPVPKEGKIDAAQKPDAAPAAAESKNYAETIKPVGKVETSAGKDGSVPAAPALKSGVSAVSAAGQTRKMEPAGAPSSAASAAPVPGSGSAPAPAPSSIPTGQAAPIFTLDVLRAQLEEKKLRVSIEEQDSKLRQLRNPPLATPVAPAPGSLDLLLNSPTVKSPVLPKMGGIGGGSPARPRGSYVESIQGVDGKLSAIVRSGGKAVTLRPGDSFAGGVVESIQYNQVTIRRGKAKSVLPFSE